MLLHVPLWQMTCLELQRCHQTQDRLWHQEARNCRNRWSDRHIPGIIDTIPWFDLAGCYSHYQSTALDPFCICLHLFWSSCPASVLEDVFGQLSMEDHKANLAWSQESALSPLEWTLPRRTGHESSDGAGKSVKDWMSNEARSKSTNIYKYIVIIYIYPI